MAQELKFNLQLNITLKLHSVLFRHTKNMAIDGHVCFYGWLFADPVKPKVHYRACGTNEQH